MTKISVVIPTKNEEKSIGKCIEKIQRVFNELHIDGEIKKGAMAWHHQYIGNPVLTWIAAERDDLFRLCLSKFLNRYVIDY